MIYFDYRFDNLTSVSDENPQMFLSVGS